MTTIKRVLRTYHIIPLFEKELLCAHVLGKTREFVITHPEMNVGRLNDWKIKRLFRKRMAGMPIAYLTGHKEFFGLDFIVNKNVLIPRPDTEIMVENTIKKINEQRATNNEQKIVMIDVGTGTGCIPITILDQILKSGLPVIRKCYATDISKSALKVARLNAKKHNVDITFFHGNLLKPLLKNYELRTCLVGRQAMNSQLIVTANLPYLTQQQFQKEPSIQHEPKSALIAKKNGLALYEELLKQIRNIVTCYMTYVTCYMEIDPSQTQQISHLIQTSLYNPQIHIHKDLAGYDRVVEINS